VFVSAYDEVARSSGEYASVEEADPLLQQFELEAAFVDLRHALLHRPEWVGVVLRSVAALAG
jgi:predicted trehalose synthase